MNNNSLDKMRKMKMFGMFQAFKTSLESGQPVGYTIDEMIGYLIETEWDDRQNRRIDRQITNARFRYKAFIEELSYQTERSLDRNQLLRLADCDFIKRNEALLITGSTGIGKSYIASALGHQACILGYRTVGRCRVICQHPQVVCPIKNGQSGWVLSQRANSH
ncbi:ATP-binding protein [Larkinella sp. VNQ87]|uniref:ATP-binding protein n=1 Tax=Larkinella sp. VNQ87 TaxID=3400921 RepID=UPI003C11ECD8